MNKIIILGSLLLSSLSLAYAIKQKLTLDRKVRDAEIRAMQQKISTQDVFMHPTEEALKKFTRKSCRNIADQINNNSYSDDDYGNLSREYAILILKSLANNMPDGVSLADYFEGKHGGSI